MAFTSERKIYMDFNATTPVDSEVIKTIMEAYKIAWGNPSSSYSTGKRAKDIIEEARMQVAQMINASSSDIIFTSGGTESNNLVIHSAINEYLENKIKNTDYSINGTHISDIPHIITTNIEHDSIKIPLEHLSEKKIIESTFVPVSKVTGCVEVDDILSAVRHNTCLVTVMLANNETGIIQPVAEIARAIKKLNRERRQSGMPNMWIHTDAAQAVGKIETAVNELEVDYLTIVGHKFYGPRIGALYCNQNGITLPKIHPMLFGGGQECSFRPGTENTPMIAGLGKAAELVTDHLDEYQAHMKNICTYLENKLKAAFGNDVNFNGKRKGTECLPNTCSISFYNCNLTGSEILEKANIIEASVGAACHKSLKLSNILLASGVPDNLARTTLRLSIGRETTKDDIDLTVDALKNVLHKSEKC